MRLGHVLHTQRAQVYGSSSIIVASVPRSGGALYCGFPCLCSQTPTPRRITVKNTRLHTSNRAFCPFSFHRNKTIKTWRRQLLHVRQCVPLPRDRFTDRLTCRRPALPPPTDAQQIPSKPPHHAPSPFIAQLPTRQCSTRPWRSIVSQCP